MQRSLLAPLLLLFATFAAAQGHGTWIVGEGKSASCLADRAAARNDATIAATNDAYARCVKANDDWNPVPQFQLPGNETRGNPRESVRCTPCAGASGPGFQCTVRLLPQRCQQDGQPVASNADWNAPDRAQPPAASSPPKAAAGAGAPRPPGATSGTQAGDASRCVAISDASNAQTLTNTCTESIVVAWCIRSDGPRVGVAGCGANGKHFQRTATLPARGSTVDPVTLPLNTSIDVGACFGGRGSYRPAEGSGAYVCEAATAPGAQQAPASGKAAPAIDASRVVATASGRSEEEACLQARSIAMETGAPGACSCRARAAVHVCQVQTNGPKPSYSVLRAVKERLRELLRCNPEVETCKPPANGGSGVRG